MTRTVEDRMTAARADTTPALPAYSRRYAAENMPSSASTPAIFAPLADSAAGAAVAEHAKLVAAFRAASVAASAHDATRDQVNAADAAELAAALRRDPDTAELPSTSYALAWQARSEELARRASGLRDAVISAYVALIETIGVHADDMRSTFTAEAAEARAKLDAHLTTAAELVAVIDRREAALTLTADIAAASPTDRIRERGTGVYGLIRSGPSVLAAPALLALIRQYRAPEAPTAQPDAEAVDSGEDDA